MVDDFGFVEYYKELDMHGIEPFMLEVKDGVPVEDAFLQWLKDSMLPCQNIERNIKALVWAMSNLYILIDQINVKKDLKQSPSIRRKVVSQTLTVKDDKTYRLIQELKYRYESPKSNGKGTKKSFHVRRKHNRHLKIKDEFGNIIGEKVITIKEMRIHPEEENITTIKILPSE